jgi:hypothetical protein
MGEPNGGTPMEQDTARRKRSRWVQRTISDGTRRRARSSRSITGTRQRSITIALGSAYQPGPRCGVSSFRAARYYVAMKTAIIFLALCLPALADFAAGERACVSGDYAKALKEFGALARQGNAGAQMYLGTMYSKGHGVPQDYKEAVRDSTDRAGTSAPVRFTARHGRPASGRNDRESKASGPAHARG